MPRKLLDGSRKREADQRRAAQARRISSNWKKPERADGCGKVAEPIRDCGFFERALFRGEATGRGQGKVKRSGNGDVAVTWRERGAELRGVAGCPRSKG